MRKWAGGVLLSTIMAPQYKCMEIFKNLNFCIYWCIGLKLAEIFQTSSDWSRFVICVRALKVREEAERTHIMIMESRGDVRHVLQYNYFLGQHFLFRVIILSIQVTLGYPSKESTPSFPFVLNIDSHILL